MTPATRLPDRAPAWMLALGALLAATAAQAQPADLNAGPTREARVLSSTPIVEAGRTVGYSVEYSVDGQRYTTRTDTPPGATLPVQITPLGVATYSVAPRRDGPAAEIDAVTRVDRDPPALASRDDEDDDEPPWARVAPQSGVVVSSGQPYGVVAPAAGYPVYGAPVAVYPAPYPPAYAYPHAYAYPRAYAYPPVNLSLSLGYSRGWRGHGWHHRPYRWR